jgi:hypothetical protein
MRRNEGGKGRRELRDDRKGDREEERCKGM